MRITYVAPFGLGEKTTVWARILPLAKELVSLGHSVAIVIPPWDTPEDAGKEWIDDGVLMQNIQLGGGTLGILWRMLQAVRSHKPGIVHIVKPRAYAGLIQWWLWQTRRILPSRSPLILLDIDDWEQSWSQMNQYGWLLSQFLRWQEEWGICHADGISAASRWLVEKAKAYASDCPILYLPNGVSQPSDVNGAEHPVRSAPSVLYFTRFIEVEPEWLAQFWHHLRMLFAEANLVVAGNALTLGRDALFQQAMNDFALDAATSDAKSNVSWLGYVPAAELPALYVSAACAIFPSDEKPLLQAKCSVKLATVLLHGVPVIASAVGQQAEYGASGAALLLPPDTSPEAFAEAVANVLKEPKQQEQLGTEGQKRLLTEFNWKSLGLQLEGFYRGFVG